MLAKREKGEIRTTGQLKEQYEIERELASRFRNASKPERPQLYSTLYDELYRRVPQLTQKTSPEEITKAVSIQMCFLDHFLNRDSTFLEIGPGNCALSFEVARSVKRVYAVDVSAGMIDNSALPPNFQLILFDGCSIPVPSNSTDVAYSHQLMEHLHPNDASEQLQDIHRILTPGGIYICITPNRLNGPHDISKYFGTVAMGLHLKEYTTSELSNLFRMTGFSRIRAYIGAKGLYMCLPLFVISLVENLLSVIPYSPRKVIATSLPFRLLLGIRMVGTK